MARARLATAHESCAVVTTAPNALMEPIHHRMPVLLTERTAWDAWLDPRNDSITALARLLHPLPAEAMTAMAVSPHVNSNRQRRPRVPRCRPANNSSVSDSNPTCPRRFPSPTTVMARASSTRAATTIARGSTSCVGSATAHPGPWLDRVASAAPRATRAAR
jgi:hypothetical protein